MLSGWKKLGTRSEATRNRPDRHRAQQDGDERFVAQAAVACASAVAAKPSAGAAHADRHLPRHRSQRPGSMRDVDVRAVHGPPPRSEPENSRKMRSQMPSTSSSSEEKTATEVPVVREAPDDVVDLRLGADVDPTRRLIEEQQFGVREQALGEDDLLLVAAGQLVDRLVDGVRRDAQPLARTRWPRRARQRPWMTRRVDSRRRFMTGMFSPDGERGEEALGPPLLRHERDARRRWRASASRPTGRPLKVTEPAEACRPRRGPGRSRSCRRRRARRSPTTSPRSMSKETSRSRWFVRSVGREQR